MLSRSQLAAWSWGLEETGSESNKYYKQQASVEHTQVLWELLFPEKIQDARAY